MPAYAARDALDLPLPAIARFREVAMVRTWQEHFISLDELRALNPDEPGLASSRRARTEDDRVDDATRARAAAAAASS
ncbi:MAG: hypothetical protein R3B48_08140 [Kofleriaceae bacterium]